MNKLSRIGIALLAMGITCVSAQLPHLPKVLVFGNFTYANPTGSTFSNGYNYGGGFEIGGGIGFKKTIVYVASGNMKYNSHGNDANAVANGNVSVTPLKLGVRRYIFRSLFVNAAAGMAVQSYEKNNTTGTNFLYEAGAGIKLLFLEFGAAYSGWQQPNSVSSGAFLFKAGFSFKI